VFPSRVCVFDDLSANEYQAAGGPYSSEVVLESLHLPLAEAEECGCLGSADQVVVI